MKLFIDQVSYSYKELQALKEICFSLDKGDVLVIVGPNGSGKSTLLKCIGRILSCHEGSVILDDEKLDTISSIDLSRRIAYVSQRISEVMSSTVFDAILLGRKPYIRWNTSENDLRIVSEILQKMDLSDLAMRDVNTLSGGQQQRVSIARALSQEPEVLLLDEPVANLDLYHQAEIMDYLTELAKEGMTIVTSLHDISLAAQYCDKVLMLDRGSLFAYGGKEIITAKNIRRLYHIDAEIIHHDGQLFILPKRKFKNEKK